MYDPNPDAQYDLETEAALMGTSLAPAFSSEEYMPASMLSLSTRLDTSAADAWLVGGSET